MFDYVYNEWERVIKEACGKDFGTANETYKIAIKRNPSIRLQDVKDYLNSRQDIQVKVKYKNIVALSVQVRIMSMKLI